MLYSFLVGLAKLLLKHRLEVSGAEQIPAAGSVVLVANHRHAFDPVVLALVSRRPIYFLGKKELFEKPVAAWFLKKINCIPIDRDNTDRAALRQAIGVLQAQEILGVFPEGTRSRTGELLPFKGGVSFIASQVDAMIVPIAVTGAERLLRIGSPKVRVRIGEAFPYAVLPGEKRRAAMERMTRVQEDAVRNLLLSE